MKKIIYILSVIACSIGFVKTQWLQFILLIGVLTSWYHKGFKILPDGHPILSRTLKIVVVLLIVFVITLFQTKIIVPNDFTGKYCLDDWEVPFFRSYYEKKLLAKLKKDFNVDLKLPIYPEWNKTYTEMYRDNYRRFYLRTLVTEEKEYYTYTLGDSFNETQEAFWVYYDLKSKKIYGTVYAYIFKEEIEKDFRNRLQEAGITLDSEMSFCGRFLDYDEFDGDLTYEKFISLKEPVLDAYLYLYTDSPYAVLYEKELPELLETLKSDKFAGFNVCLTLYKKGDYNPYYHW